MNADLIVNDILEKHVEAVGGRETWQKITVFSYEGIIAVPGRIGKITYVAKAPDKYYQMVDLEIVKQETGYDGQVGWWKDQSGLRKLFGTELEQARESTIYERLQYHNKELVSCVRLVGMEKAESYVIEFVLRSGRKIVTYYDAKTFLELKSVSEVTVGSAKIKSEKVPSNYRNVEGILLPFKVKQITPIGESETIVTHYKLNIEVDDAIFEMPKR